MKFKTIEHKDGTTLVTLEGRLDVSGMNTIDNQFYGATTSLGRPTVVDLSALEFIGSLGIGMLMGCARALKAKGSPLVLLNPCGLVLESLERVRIREIIPVATSMEEAKTLLQGG